MASLLSHLSLLLILVAVSHGKELTGRDYWNSVLPDTPMPDATSKVLDSGTTSGEDTGTSVQDPQIAKPDGVSVGVGPGGVSVGVGPRKQNPGKQGGVSVGVGPGGVSVGVGPAPAPAPRKQNPGGVSVGVSPGGVGVGVGPAPAPGNKNPGKENPEGVSVGVGPGGVGVGVGSAPGPEKQNPGKQGGVSVGVGHGGVGVHVHPGKQKPYRQPFDYKYAASETQLKDDPNVALFFLQKDLKPGTKMTLNFAKITPNAPHFIPRSEADKLPFSSSKFPEILNRLKIQDDSPQAEEIKQTLEDCESPAINGEKKLCATSLESMVDFTVTSLKTRKLHPFSTNSNSSNSPKQQYEITRSNIISKHELVACHVEPYAYAVFYCHLAKSTEAYMVNLTGEDGNRIEAIAICHLDTSSWNPKHLAFQVLKVEPGSKPVCHFLPQDHVAWTRSI